MSAIALGTAIHLRSLTAGLKSQVERMEKNMGHREMLFKDDNDSHVLDAYTRVIDADTDRIMRRVAAIKEEILRMRGEA